jgi:hypothetical protein
MIRAHLSALLVALAAASLVACKAKDAAPSATTAPGETSSGAVTAANGSGATNAKTNAAEAPQARTFEGTYEAAPGNMFVPREGDVPNAAEWAGTKFRGDDAGVGRGPGTITLRVTPGGEVSGEGAGSLGAFTVVGRKLGERLRGTLRGGGPEAFHGTFDLVLAGAGASGTAAVSDGEARVVRTLTITLNAK